MAVRPKPYPVPSANNRHRACHGLLRTLGRHPEAIVDISCIAPESSRPGLRSEEEGAQVLKSWSSKASSWLNSIMRCFTYSNPHSKPHSQDPWALVGDPPRGSGRRLPGALGHSQGPGLWEAARPGALGSPCLGPAGPAPAGPAQAGALGHPLGTYLR